MKANKETMYALLKEIQALIAENENADGTCRFDMVRVVAALDFVKTEIEKTIST